MPTWLIILLLVVLFGGVQVAGELLYAGLVLVLFLALFGLISGPIGGGTVLIIIILLILL